MYEIFEKLLEEKGVTAYAVSKATGIRPSTFTAWKKGGYRPKDDKREKIAEYFGVTLAYLDGKSEHPHGEPTLIQNFVDSKEMLRVSVFDKIPKNVRLNTIDEIQGEIMIKNYNDGNTYWGLTCTDDSMFPKILKNDTIVFRESETFNNEDICVVGVEHFENAIVRKIVQTPRFIILQPLNPGYDAMYFDDIKDIEIIGVVVGLHREF